MKTIGLIGGMSWESSIVYYQVINELARHRLGGLHSASCVMYSFDFDEIVMLQKAARWDEATARMVGAAKALERAGADVGLICTNTMHKMFDDVQAAVSIPMIHIADPTARTVKQSGLETIGLLATRFTMEQEFYTGRLVSRHGLKVLTPESPEERQEVHDIIFDELCQGHVRPASRERIKAIMTRLAERGAEGIILGCTEIGLLVKKADCPLPLFDTTLIHAEAAVAWAMNGTAEKAKAR